MGTAVFIILDQLFFAAHSLENWWISLGYSTVLAGT